MLELNFDWLVCMLFDMFRMQKDIDSQKYFQKENGELEVQGTSRLW